MKITIDLNTLNVDALFNLFGEFNRIEKFATRHQFVELADSMIELKLNINKHLSNDGLVIAYDEPSDTFSVDAF